MEEQQGENHFSWSSYEIQKIYTSHMFHPKLFRNHKNKKNKDSTLGTGSSSFSTLEHHTCKALSAGSCCSCCSCSRRSAGPAQRRESSLSSRQVCSGDASTTCTAVKPKSRPQRVRTPGPVRSLISLEKKELGNFV